MAFTKTGFDTRSSGARDAADYNQAMTWVITMGGTATTMQLNGNSHFARKHLLLPTRDAVKKAQDKSDYGWGLHWLRGIPTGVDAHIEQKMQNRLDNRNAKDWAAAAGSDERRWADKYRGHAGANVPANTVINLVTTSQKSIAAKKAAEVCAKALNASVIAVGAQANVTFDFGSQCVLSWDGTNITSASSMIVVVRKTAADTYLFIHRHG